MKTSSILQSSQALFLVDVLVHHMWRTSHWYFDDFGRVANGNLSQEEKSALTIGIPPEPTGGIPTSLGPWNRRWFIIFFGLRDKFTTGVDR